MANEDGSRSGDDVFDDSSDASEVKVLLDTYNLSRGLNRRKRTGNELMSSGNEVSKSYNFLSELNRRKPTDNVVEGSKDKREALIHGYNFVCGLDRRKRTGKVLKGSENELKDTDLLYNFVRDTFPRTRTAREIKAIEGILKKANLKKRPETRARDPETRLEVLKQS
ncbi:hypothetical protein PGTUg99_035507 [Puccinia graminis f. sp. tritici]|uniref:Uncharacterized protein n=1 Tax=Puccinia graminis f. sp. tritici TaxID=56615 RepID=A0A5B0RN29_PUCGR|nr:hypothetical protein PGTUg99_035507 [Puccinia graminis f. sp. tritici]